MNRFVGACLFLLILFVPSVPAVAQSPNAGADLIARVNRERVARGLVPYAVSASLMAAAQGQAVDLATRGNYSHSGSDGSTVHDRVRRKGYGTYSWGTRVGENWAHYHDTATAMAMWMNSKPHRDNILHPVYREIGVGVAATSQGGFVYILNFGAQPNVLPFFISDGAQTTNTQNVNLTLSGEEADPDGDGPNSMGRPQDVLVANDPNFTGANWRPYAGRIPWTLTTGDGTKTVYVRYRDARGRTALSSDSIVYDDGSPAATATRVSSVTPTRTATRKPSPTRTKTATRPRPSRTPLPPATPTDPDLEVVLLPTDTVTPTIESSATETPLPIEDRPAATQQILVAALNEPRSAQTPVAAAAIETTDPVAPVATLFLGIGLAFGGLAVFKFAGIRLEGL